MIEIRFCAICFPVLQRTGLASMIYEEICKFVAIEKIPYLVNLDENKVAKHELLNFLENKGFIISTEISLNHIMIKPTGHEVVEDEEGETHLFCKDGLRCWCDYE